MTPQQKAKDKRDRELYNLLPGDRERIAKFQNYKDPITGAPLKPNAHLDHDHKTGLCRGLLNPMTNKRLVDDVRVLAATQDYLRIPPATVALGERVYGLIGKAMKKKVMKYGPDGSSTPKPRRVKGAVAL